MEKYEREMLHYEQLIEEERKYQEDQYWMPVDSKDYRHQMKQKNKQKK